MYNDLKKYSEELKDIKTSIQNTNNMNFNISSRNSDFSFFIF